MTQHKVSQTRTWRRFARPFGVVLLLLMTQPLAAGALHVAFEATVPMSCFPPPNGPEPPCPLPVGLDPALTPDNPTGSVRVRSFANGWSSTRIKLTGIPEDLRVTAWIVFFPPNVPPPHPIFGPAGPGLPPIALPNSPLAWTGAAFTEGLAREPNEFRVRRDGTARLDVLLDYDLMQANEVPLTNGMVLPNQGLAPIGSGAEQPPCCPNGFPFAGPQLQGASLLRQFDQITGRPLLDDDGRPLLLRSPLRTGALVIIGHHDGTTHGIYPGATIPPFIPGLSVEAGDNFVIGLFPLGNIPVP